VSDIINIKQILHEVIGCLHDFISMFDQYIGSDGDHSYFADLKNEHAKTALDTMHSTMKELEILGRKLESLHKPCSEARESVRYTLTNMTGVFVDRAFSLCSVRVWRSTSLIFKHINSILIPADSPGALMRLQQPLYKLQNLRQEQHAPSFGCS
jgi:hypothetical protein